MGALKKSKWAGTKAVASLLFGVFALLMTTGCSAESGSTGNPTKSDGSQPEDITYSSSIGIFSEDREAPYDPNNESFYYDPAGTKSHNAEGKEVVDKSWNSNQVYLHDLTKSALCELVELHLKSSERLVGVYQRMDPEEEGYKEQFDESVLNKHEQRIQKLAPLLERVQDADENDFSALEEAYSDFLLIIGAPKNN